MLLSPAPDVEDIVVSSASEHFNLRIAIAYQTTECQKRALTTCAEMLARLGSDYEFTRTAWKFDLLE